MIFTGFKRKTNQIFFNKKLIEVKNKNDVKKNNKIKKVLVFLSKTEDQKVILNDLAEKLNISINQFEVVIFQTKKDKNNLIKNAFYTTDFGWYGKIKSTFLNNILTKKYDLLINYSKVENIYINLLLLLCKSDFKVGFGKMNQDLFQLLIDCDINNFKLFNEELKKYLTILKKI